MSSRKPEAIGVLRLSSRAVEDYSKRSALIGSTFVARRAGTHDATRATAIIATAAPAIGDAALTGSVIGASTWVVATSVSTLPASPWRRAQSGRPPRSLRTPAVT